MSAEFASTADMADKTITFDSIGPDLYAFTAEGDPNSGVIVGDDGVMVIDAQATPVMARQVIERVARVTDKPIKYVLLTHYHAVRVLGASAYAGAEIMASGANARADRRARQGGYGLRDRPLSAPVPRGREHPRPHLALDHVSRPDVGMARPPRSAHHAYRARTHRRRRRRVRARTPMSCSPAISSNITRPAIAATRISPTGRRRSTGWPNFPQPRWCRAAARR